MATLNFPIDDHDWELINDDGFVYKRRKRSRLDPTTSTSSSAPPPPPDPAVEEENRRERKRRALCKLKEKYQSELSQWEILSNSLKDMQQKSEYLQQQRQLQATTSSAQLIVSPEPLTEPTSLRLIDELISQVEAQEAIIRDVSNLCDVAEALCDAREAKLKQSFTELPVWDPSPIELITSLCEDQG